MKYMFARLCVVAALWLHFGCARVNVFEEPPGHPVVDSLAPASGTIGTQVRLYGSGFSTTLSHDTVNINGVLVRVDGSTSTVLLVTLIDSTGTGHVNVKVNGQSAQGPVFTYNSNGSHPEAPVITNAAHGWYDGSGYSVNVNTLPADDNSVHLTVGGVDVPIDIILKPGHPGYDPAEGLQILIRDDSKVEDHTTGNYANYVVTYNGVSSNLYPYQLIPKIADISSGSGGYRFGIGDTLTIKGKFFGNGSALPSSFYLPYYGQQLPQPAILSWTNTEIRAVVPAYPQVPAGTGMNVGITVGAKTSPTLGCTYYGNLWGKVYLIAGSDQGSNNGHGALAQFNGPTGLALNAAGDLYIADQANNRIRKIINITASGGDVTTVAGSTAGFRDGGYADAWFNQPTGVAVDENGAVYVTDFANNRVRMLSGGIVSTFAGDGNTQSFWYPAGIAMNNHNVAYVADMNNNRIQLLINHTLGTLAGGTYGFQDGTGATARFVYPRGVALGADGTVYVADAGNHAIRKISPAGAVTTLAGGQQGNIDGTGAAARFDGPGALAVDAQGNVYVADFGFGHIRKVSPQGVVTTLTGKFADGSGAAVFNAPAGIAVDAQGALYISDAGTHRIYKIAP